MPFPNPKVLTSFLREYLYYRKVNTWNTTTSLITSYYRDDEQIKTSQCFEVNRQFYNAERLKTLNGWVELIFTLGERGRESSRFAETLQAIRNYIITFLKESEHKEELQQIILELTKQANALDMEVLEAMEAKEAPKQVARLESNYHQTLLKLADLGDHTAIFKAQRLGLFNNLERPNLGDRNLPMFNDVNGSIPFAYHDKACLFYYYRFIKPLPKWQVSFDDFVTTSAQFSPDIEDPVQVSVDNNRPGIKSALGGFVASFFGGNSSQDKSSLGQGSQSIPQVNEQKSTTEVPILPQVMEQKSNHEAPMNEVIIHPNQSKGLSNSNH